MPSGLKNKMVILHATTTTKVKIDHTKRPLLTHMLHPGACVRTPPVFGWGRGSHTLPTPPSQKQTKRARRAPALKASTNESGY